MVVLNRARCLASKYYRRTTNRILWSVRGSSISGWWELNSCFIFLNGYDYIGSHINLGLVSFQMLLLSSCGLPTAAAPHPLLRNLACCSLLRCRPPWWQVITSTTYTTTIPRILQFDGPDDLFVVVIDTQAVAMSWRTTNLSQPTWYGVWSSIEAHKLS